MSRIMESIRAQMLMDCVPDPKECWCRGSGWVYTDWDSHHECPYHYRGQPHSESDPDEYDYWCDTIEAHGGGQFPVIPSEPCEPEWPVPTDSEDDLPF